MTCAAAALQKLDNLRLPNRAWRVMHSNCNGSGQHYGFHMHTSFFDTNCCCMGMCHPLQVWMCPQRTLQQG